jgi:hypothetical protein
MSDILMIVTGATSLTMKDGSEHPTGFWAEELVTAHRDLIAAGHDITIATPGGVTPIVDRGSLDAATVGGQEAADAFAAYLASIADELAAAVPVADVDPAGFAAVVIPGGHGPMSDLAFDANVGRVLVAANGAGTIIAPSAMGPPPCSPRSSPTARTPSPAAGSPCSPTRRSAPAVPERTRRGVSRPPCARPVP